MKEKSAHGLNSNQLKLIAIPVEKLPSGRLFAQGILQ